MGKKKLNELDPAAITLTRLLGHANPATGKMNRATIGDLVALFSTQTPVKTYTDIEDLLDNDDLSINYLAFVSEAGGDYGDPEITSGWGLYLYNGPDADELSNYTLLASEEGTGGGGAVDSVNGQTGVVVLDAGDVGADPAGTAAALLTGTISDSDTTHAPTGNAVFDALALKAALTQVIGVQDVNIPAAAIWPRGTDGCAPLTNYSMATSLLDVMALRFGLTGAEYAQTHFTLPRKWNNGTITYQIKWKPEAAGTGDVRFAVQGAAYSNDDALTGAFGTAVAVVDTYIAADDLHVTTVSGDLTISGTPAAGDLVALQVSRDPGHTDDTFTQGALFIDITLFITTTAAIDA